MPRGDGSGPAGQGPMTGRGLGYCAGYDAPGYMAGGGGGCGWGGFGRGFGRGRRGRWFGGGRGPGGGGPGGRGWWRGGWNGAEQYPEPTASAAPEQRESMLSSMRRQMEYMEKELTALKDEFKSLEAEKSESKG